MFFPAPSFQRDTANVTYNNIRVKSFDLSTLLSPCRWFLYTCMQLWSPPCFQNILFF